MPNAGKSAVLRALQPALPDDRHRTPDRWLTAELPQPEVMVTVEVSGPELRRAILRWGNEIHVPIPNNAAAENFPKEMLDTTAIRFALVRRPSGGFAPTVYPSHSLFVHTGGTTQICSVLRPQNGEIVISGAPAAINDMWTQDMFFFSAERFAFGIGGHGLASRLSPDAGNLPSVLHTLSGLRGSVFQKLVRHLREIFPTVGNLSVAPRIDNRLEIHVWPTEEMEREELNFPLGSSGTGVAQVIALLTAIMTIDNMVIIVDEINSILHPAAVKAILRILQTEYADHQYIISTHAPEVISFSNPKTIHLVKRDGYDSSIERLDLDCRRGRGRQDASPPTPEGDHPRCRERSD